MGWEPDEFRASSLEERHVVADCEVGTEKRRTRTCDVASLHI